MFGKLLRKIVTVVRWLTLAIIVSFLVEELVRVVWYVIGQWGIVGALIDGAALYKLGEFAILIPFLLLVHFNGVWAVRKSCDFIQKARWLIWLGGILTLIAAFDLVDRVKWSWWTIPLILLALVLPPVMGYLARKTAVWRGRILATVIVFLLASHYVFSFVFTGYFITPLPASHPSPADTAHGRWQQDLQYMADNLPRMHRNAFHTVPRPQFEAEVAALYDAIPDLNDHQVKAGFYRIAAMIGDGHTAITEWTGPSAGRYPIRYYWLSDGLFVVAAPEDNRDVLGGKVLRLGNLTADSAFDAVCALLPHESDSYLLYHSARYLTDIDLLRGLGIADDDGRMTLTVATNEGDKVDTDLAPVEDPGQSQLIRLPETPPFYKSQSDRDYWSEFFDDHQTAYLKYNSFTDPAGFAEFTEEFWDMVEQKSARYVIVDFRENGGGYSPCFDRFYENILSHPDINRHGRLYHLINRRTYSSASLYTGIIRRDTEAILVGEPMGGGLNRYGDMRMFNLPNSGVEVSYSTKYFELWPDTLPPFTMDLQIDLSSRDYFAARDPVLDTILHLSLIHI